MTEKRLFRKRFGFFAVFRRYLGRPVSHSSHGTRNKMFLERFYEKRVPAEKSFDDWVKKLELLSV